MAKGGLLAAGAAGSMGRVAGVAGLVASVLAGTLWIAGIVLCAGGSMPKGVYIKVVRIPMRVAVGDVVLACLPGAAIAELALDRGYLAPGPCLGNSARLIKRVAAVGGDRVLISASGVSVNGRSWPASTPLTTDAAGRPTPNVVPLDRTLSSEEVLLMSDGAPSAFDGRYFGATPRQHVLCVLKPLLIEEVRR